MLLDHGCIFFFKQKTAYEMRISDWSSDVCSSDLKLTGDWYDPRTGKRNADALIAGEAVVLVADWVKESDITDSGFSEAAAESIYASIIALDRATMGGGGGAQGKILSTPMHFKIGRAHV